MVSKIDITEKIVCVIGLGYVGLPLANAFSKYFKVIGFDVDENKIKTLNDKYDNLEITSDPNQIKFADFVIIAVPTPVSKSKKPDLSFVKSASRVVGQNLKKGAVVVLESTVYPGVTEEIVGPILEKESGFVLGDDFKIGYSPERINPGDKLHTIDKITKIVSGMDESSKKELSELYGKITTVYEACDIKTAEAGKVIENIQRDLNIALVNELSIIFHKLGLDTNAVLDAAATKWNFHRYTPGLVGGHCIPVDPYYLVYKAQEIGYHPQVILAGRSVNDYMAKHVALMAIKALNDAGKVIKGSSVLLMGLTYKEDTSDTRESRVKGIIKELNEFGINLYGVDPMLNRDDIIGFDVELFEDSSMKIDCIIVVVAHDEFKKMKLENIKRFMNDKPVLIDVRGCFDRREAEELGFVYRCL